MGDTDGPFDGDREGLLLGLREGDRLGLGVGCEMIRAGEVSNER